MNSNNKTLKVIFICSSLEPGRDGVGDYCRRLAAALISNGHACGLLSLNDRFINHTYTGTQQSDGINIPVMRCASATEITIRFAEAGQWVNEHDPQWLSLQYVPFGYHPKGLKFGLSKLLLQLGKGRQWHIMFHELWVGMAKEESLKLKIWGALQRQLIKSLVRNIRPAVVHTNTRLYEQYLRKLGVAATYLPLFGNIPLVGRQVVPGSPDISFVIFGAIHDRAPVQAFATELAAYAKVKQIQVLLTIMGRPNVEQKRWADAWQTQGLEVKLLGEQPAEKVSEILSASNIGISATALAVIGKSGSYAAMREHGLPVLSVSKPWTPRNAREQIIPTGVIPYQQGQLAAHLDNFKYVSHGNSVSAVSVKFAQALKLL